MSESPPSLSKGKVFLFSLLAVALSVGLAEGVARVLEPTFFPYKRTLPLAAPRAPGRDELRGAQHKEKLLLQNHAAPDWAERLPLVASEELGWSLAAGEHFTAHGAEIRTNSLGMRGPELSPKVEGERRLFTLGDSSIFGDGVREEHIFSTVAAQILQDAWGVKVTGVIGGVPGHDTSQSLARLKSLGPRVAPDWVVIGNLWSDVYRAEQELGADAFGYLPPMKERLRGSALYRLLWRVYSPWLRAREVRWLADRGDVGEVEGPGGTRVPLPRYIENLRAMVEESKSLGARVAFLILPAPLDFDAVPPPDTVDRFRLAMKAVAEDVGAPLLNGPEFFESEGAGVGYFKDQVHPNQEGHALLGLGLGELIKDASEPKP